MTANRARCALAAFAATLALAACNTPGSSETSTSGTAADLTPITLGLTYVPDIQFAPFYVAAERGYYEEAGLDVTLRHHGANAGLFTAIEQGEEELVVASGDEVLTQRAAGGDLAQIATLYETSPVALIAPADSGVGGPADLKGLTIGVPGEYGSTYLGLLVLLDEAGLTSSDVTIQSIGYTQTTALLTNQVDAVMGFRNGDAVRIEAAGTEVSMLDPGSLVSVGVAATDSGDLDLEAQRAFIDATLRGVEDVIADPSAAVEISGEYIPGMTTQAKADAEAVLEATIPLLGTTGLTDEATWEAMAAAMVKAGMITQIPDGGFRN